MDKLSVAPASLNPLPEPTLPLPEDVVLTVIVLSSSDEHLSASSSASIQHLPAALVGALKMRCDDGSGCTTAPSVSPSGPRAAQMDWSIGWNSLKQKPSFFDGRSISSQVLKMIVPIQWPL